MIDSPPVGLVTDALILGAYADVSLYISKQGVRHKWQLKIINDIYMHKKLPRPCIVAKGKGYSYYVDNTNVNNNDFTVRLENILKARNS